MTVQQLHHDFADLYDALLQHPSFCFSANTEEAFRLQFETLDSAIKDTASFIDAASTLTAFFCDGHTNIEIPYTVQDRCIPLPSHWEGSNLMTSEIYRGMPTGTRITAIEGVSVTELISRMAQRIPHENEYLVMSRMVSYPYRNYHLFSDLNLQWLFGKKEAYTVTFENTQLGCPLTRYEGYLDFPEDSSFISYEIQDDTAVLHLNTCLNNEQYRRSLDALALECQSRHIDTLILDLSRNMGGDSSVIDEFVRRVDTSHYRRYAMLDCTDGTPRKITDRTVQIQNRKLPVCLPENILCKVSCHTFSSARTFAVTLRDNGLARIIGTPTGGKPSSYGKPIKGTLPHTGIRYRVSSCLFLRPDQSKDSQLSLYPDN